MVLYHNLECLQANKTASLSNVEMQKCPKYYLLVREIRKMHQGILNKMSHLITLKVKFAIGNQDCIGSSPPYKYKNASANHY